MRWNWLPWKYLIKKAAASYGFIDPASVVARLRNFAQPAEYDVPLELARAGVVFHARGLINTRAIQHNLDWVWPFWIEKQFNPRDPSFLPRSFSFTHVNLTHRDWTAVGLPDVAVYPIVDPRGLVTPFFDGWSIDFWLVPDKGDWVLPSRAETVEQVLDHDHQSMRTRVKQEGKSLETKVFVEWQNDALMLQMEAAAELSTGGYLAVVVRPYNPEGIQFVDSIRRSDDGPGWVINDKRELHFNESPDREAFSTYDEGDVAAQIRRGAETSDASKCRVGMATAAALFRVEAEQTRRLRVSMSLQEDAKDVSKPSVPNRTWKSAQAECAQLEVPDELFSRLYRSSLNTLELLSADKVYPGPYTYRRFWYRDACLMLHGMLALGLEERVHRHLSYFPDMQKRDGYFASQEGEWDSNGQVLWIFGEYARLTGRRLEPEWLESIEKGVEWLERKRLDSGEGPTAGLLPAGFSAEHFGPNDYYYWDDLWAIGGLRAVEPEFRHAGMSEAADKCRRLANEFEDSVERSVNEYAVKRGDGAIPASPLRRMDSGAIGVLVADYPLRIAAVDDDRLVKTVEYFMSDCIVNGGFFQNMQHSGVNAYLTMALAQSLLRRDDPRWQTLMHAIANAASATGHWPEAIHPFTRGGCIGDGQHGWAAAELVCWMRHAFVRQEKERLILGSGLFPEWCRPGEVLSFGETLTAFGRASVRVEVMEDEAVVTCEGDWRADPPEVEVRLPGFERVTGTAGEELRVSPSRDTASSSVS